MNSDYDAYLSWIEKLKYPYSPYEQPSQRDLELMHNSAFRNVYNRKHKNTYRGRRINKLNKDIQDELKRINQLNERAEYWMSTYGDELNDGQNGNSELIMKPGELTDLANHIAEKALNNGMPKLITKLHPEIDFKYNSYNIICGRPGDGKTTSIMKNFIKLSQIENDYHLIVYVAGTNSDDTVNSLTNYIKIPFIQTTYEDIEQQFNDLINLKEKYNMMVDGKIAKDPSILEPLHVTDFNKKRLHTYIFFDDATDIFKDKKKANLKQKFTKCRHYNLTVILCIHDWIGIERKDRSYITTVGIYKGYSKDRLRLIHNQTSQVMDFDCFYSEYLKLKKYQRLVIDFEDYSVTIV